MTNKQESENNENPFLELNTRFRPYSVQSLSLTQAKHLLSSIPDLGDMVLIELAINCGLRRGDIVSVKQADIDFETRTLKFHEHKKNRIHTVPFSEKMSQSLAMWMRMNKKSQWLFPARQKNSNHISSRTAYNILQRCLERAGLPKRPFHALRGTCVKLCQKAGWSIEQVAELTGDSIPVIQQHYATPSDEEMREVANDKAII
jgi:integrase